MLFVGACATATASRPVDADSRFWPTGKRIHQTTMDALRDPVTWAPAAGAAVVAAGGWDKKISRWAVDKTPVFGSIDGAKQASDDLRALSNFGMLGTAVSVPGRGHPWLSRLKRLMVEEAGVIAASSVTNLLKRSIARERPDQSDNHSMPSGHSTRAFAYNAMSSRNLDAMDLPGPARTSLKALFDTLAAGTAWARVEGERHYPTDVLMGASVGNFVALWMHDAFLGRDESVSMGIQVDPGQRGVQVRIRLP